MFARRSPTQEKSGQKGENFVENENLALDARRFAEYDSLSRLRADEKFADEAARFLTSKGAVMKCQKCDKVATFHITELTDSHPEELHLCEEHARQYLHQSDPRDVDDSADDDQLDGCEHCASCKRDDANENELDDAPLKELTEDLMATDFQACPCCGLGFQEFRKSGRLGCANDYQTFQDLLDPLLLGVHGATEHVGKRPTRFVRSDDGATLVRLRAQLSDAIETEDYERASELRDRIKELTPKIA